MELWYIPLTYPYGSIYFRLMEQTRVFRSNKSQAVRLPKPIAFPESVRDVDIISLGRARLIVPHGEGWDTWFDGPAVSPDFMTDRDQPDPQERVLW
jgi:antitoxin VapB